MHSTTRSARDWDVAVATGLVRVAAGIGLLSRRDWSIRMVGGSSDDPALRALFTYFGIRDLALGVSTLASSRPGTNVPRQVVVQGVADTVDAGLLTAAVATGRLPRVRGAGAIGLAAVTALAEYAGAWRLRQMI
jgi:hypothetical protein